MSESIKHRLDIFCRFRGGIGFPEPLQGRASGDHPFIKVSDMNLPRNERVIQTANNYITIADAQNIKSKPFPPGSTVFAKVGAALKLNRRRLLKDDTFIDNNMMAAIPLDPSDSSYLFYLLQLFDFGKLCQVGAVPSVNQGDLSGIKAYYPPKPERNKIAEILGACDEAIEAQERLIAQKQQRKKGLMQKLLTGEVRFPEFEGTAWREVRLNDVVKPLSRKNTDGNTNVLTSSAKHGLVSQTDYFNKSVAGANTSGYYLLKRGEFAYNRSSAKGYPYGAIKRLDFYDEGVLSTLYLCFILKDDSGVQSDFLAHLFEAGLLNHGLQSVCQQGARAHGLLNITKSDFYGLKVTVPSTEEQERIEALLNAKDEEITLQQSKLEQLKQQKKGLMQQLLTGKVRVKV